MNRIFLAGVPDVIGGASSEAWHTLKLWRRFGLSVSVLSLGQPADPTWVNRLAAVGVDVVAADPDTLADIPGLPGAVVVSFCRAKFLEHAQRFQALGCRIVWSPCMCFLSPAETNHYARGGRLFDGYHFQSDFQRAQIEPQLAHYAYRPHLGHTIHGAFDATEFPFRPLAHAPGSVFVAGRLSRAVDQRGCLALDKFAAGLWSELAAIPQPFRFRVMGWHPRLARYLGEPPAWSECLPQGAETPTEFLSQLHCLICRNGRAVENWPRVALEAMAVGTPIVAENRGGWPELAGTDGALLFDDAAGMVEAIATLVADEPRRLALIESGRRRLAEIANPDAIWAGWQRIFSAL